MSESVERGQKGNKKKKAKSGPVELPVTDTPALSKLGDTPSYHQDNINISFTRPQVSTRHQRNAVIIRYKMACEQELKMMEGMEGVMVEQIQKTKSEWFVANNLLKYLPNQRSGFLGNSAASPSSSTITDNDQRPRKRRREEADSSSIKCYAEQRRCALHHQCRPRNIILKYTKALFENSKGAFNILTHGFQPLRDHNFIVMSSMVTHCP